MKWRVLIAFVCVWGLFTLFSLSYLTSDPDPECRADVSDLHLYCQMHYLTNISVQQIICGDQITVQFETTGEHPGMSVQEYERRTTHSVLRVDAGWALLTRTTRKSENLRPMRKVVNVEIHTIEKKDIVIVFPYRDRAIHYKKIMEHLTSITRENWRIHTILVEQDDKSPFRRSWLLNIGIAEAKKHVPGDNTCVVTHDVDMIADSKVDYGWCDSPTQICSELSCFNGGVPYSTSAGGVVQASLKDWYTINGFTNTAIGWGGEDDDLHIRFQANGLLTDGHIRRPAKGFGKCHCMNDNDHTKRVRDEKGYSDIVEKISRMGHGSNEWKTDGLNSLQYHVSEESVDKYGTICLKVKTTAPTHELSGQRSF